MLFPGARDSRYQNHCLLQAKVVGGAVWELSLLKAVSRVAPGAIKYLKTDGHKYHSEDQGKSTIQRNLTHGSSEHYGVE